MSRDEFVVDADQSRIEFATKRHMSWQNVGKAYWSMIKKAKIVEFHDVFNRGDCGSSVNAALQSIMSWWRHWHRWLSTWTCCSHNWPNLQISECTCSISHNVPFRTEMCTFLFWMEHCVIWNRCILRFAKLVYWPVLGESTDDRFPNKGPARVGYWGIHNAS